MKDCRTTFFLTASLLCAATAATAQTASPSTMTCTDDSTILLTLPITSISIDVPGPIVGPAFFTVTADFSQFNLLANDRFQNNVFEDCTFTPGNGTFLGGISIEDVTGHADPGQQYTQMTLSYYQLGIGPTGAVSTMPKPKIPLTAEQRQKFLADYLARLPKPSLAK